MVERRKQVLLVVACVLAGSAAALVSGIAAGLGRQRLEAHLLAGLSVLLCCLAYYTHLHLQAARLAAAGPALAWLNRVVPFLAPMSLSCVPLLLAELLGLGPGAAAAPGWVLSLETALVCAPSVYACYVGPAVVRGVWQELRAACAGRRRLLLRREELWSLRGRPREPETVRRYLALFREGRLAQGLLDPVEASFLACNFTWRPSESEARHLTPYSRHCLLCGGEFCPEGAVFVGPCCRRLLHAGCLRRHLQASAACPSFLCKRHFRLSHLQKLEAAEQLPLQRFLGLKLDPPAVLLE